MVRDSWKIAEHLEDALSGQARALRRRHRPRRDAGLQHLGGSRAGRPHAAGDRPPTSTSASIRPTRSISAPWPKGDPQRRSRSCAPRRDEALQRLGTGLEPMQAHLKRQAYICGDTPAYADYVLFSVFQWARVMSPREAPGPRGPAVCLARARARSLRRLRAQRAPTALRPALMREAALRLAEEPARHRLPRRGVGRPGARRPQALRMPHARGRAGGAFLGHDPRQARELPARVRALRHEKGRRATARANAGACSPTRASSGIPARSMPPSTTRAACIEVRKEFGTFSKYVWSFAGAAAPRRSPRT